MGRPRLYATAAERQQAYRLRAAEEPGARRDSLRHPKECPPKALQKRPPSRPARLAAIIRSLQTLLTEYEHWQDRLPEFQDGSEQQNRLAETIESMEQALDLLTEIQPPRGYGKD